MPRSREASGENAVSGAVINRGKCMTRF